MSDASARISFVTDASKRQRLDQIAEAFGQNLSMVINEAIDHYIELHEWQLKHIQKGVDAARQGDFASEEEVQAFFAQHGNAE